MPRFRSHQLLIAGLALAVAASPAATSAAPPPEGARVSEGEKPASAERGKDALPTRALARMKAEPSVRSDAIYHAVFSPDGKRLACTGASGTIRVWDTATGKEACQLTGHQGPIWNIAFAPDGKTLVSGGTDQTVRVWDVAKGKELRQIGSQKGTVYAVAFSPDGKTLATGHGGTIRVWDYATGKELSQLPGHTGGIWPLAFSPDGKLLASGSGDGWVGVWDLASGKDLFQVQGHRGGVWPVAFSPDGKTLVSSGWMDHSIRLWEVATAKPRRLIQHPSLVRYVALSPDGKTLASAGDDRVTRLWEVATGQERCRFEGQQSPVLLVVFSPDGKKLASGGEDGTTLIWDVTHRFKEHLQPIPLSPRELEDRWRDLADKDAGKAYESIGPLATAPKQTVPFLQERLKPAAAPEPKRVARLIADLDDDSFLVRERAMIHLDKLGSAVEPALREALKRKPSLEVQVRIERLLCKLEGPLSCPERLRQLRAIEVLEQIGTEEARQLLKALAEGTPEALETVEAKAALQRLSRLARAD